MRGNQPVERGLTAETQRPQRTAFLGDDPGPPSQGYGSSPQRTRSPRSTASSRGHPTKATTRRSSTTRRTAVPEVLGPTTRNRWRAAVLGLAHLRRRSEIDGSHTARQPTGLPGPGPEGPGCAQAEAATHQLRCGAARSIPGRSRCQIGSRKPRGLFRGSGSLCSPI
jgi:hypothetical protein